MRRLIALSLLASCSAVDAATNVLLVVNGDSWASTYIANEYAAAREIPARNIVTLRDIPSFDRMNVDDFRERILVPALRTAEQRGLAVQMDYLLYSADFPTAIDVSSDMKGKEFPKSITQPASLTGLSYFYQFTQAKNPSYLGLNANFYYRERAYVSTGDPFTPEQQQQYTDALKVLQAAGAEHAKNPGAKVDETALRALLPALLALRDARPKNTELLYNIACVYGLLGDGDSGVRILAEAIESGWWDLQHAAKDPDLAKIRDRDDFKALGRLVRRVKFEHAPSGGFRGLVGWQPGGRPAQPNQGMRYLLSTMLACTSGRGNSVKDALASLSRSISADGTRPAGTVYFMENQDVRSTTREWAFAGAAQKVKSAGLGASVEKGVLPSGKSDVAGAVVGISDFDWNGSGSTILPGAICEHLTSFGGAMQEGAGQTPLTEFIRFGAAGASGTVTEPYAIQAKFPSPYLQWHYAQGCTLGEAFYQSVAGPYQLLIVGDALCAPWRKPARVWVEGLKDGATLKGVLAFRVSAAFPDGVPVGSFELYVDGARVGAVKPSDGIAFDSAKLPDGPHTIAVVANAADAIASRIEKTYQVAFQNHSGTLTVTGPKGDWPWDKELEFRASAPGAKEIVFMHASGELARLGSAEGVVRLDARKLGQGRSRIQPVAIMDGGRELWGEAIAMNVKPPAALPAGKPKGPLGNGIAVTNAGGTRSISARADGDWLAAAGVKAGETFTVEGWLSISVQDVHQFQINGADELKLSVNGIQQAWRPGNTWNYIPVHLAPGMHFVQITGKSKGAQPLDVRFGGPGSRKLDGSWFQHEK